MEVQNLPPLVPPQGGDRVWLLLQRITLRARSQESFWIQERTSGISLQTLHSEGAIHV